MYLNSEKDTHSCLLIKFYISCSFLSVIIFNNELKKIPFFRGEEGRGEGRGGE